MGKHKFKKQKVDNPDNILCKHGCNQIGRYQNKDKSWCCSDHQTKCPENVKKNSQSKTGIIFSEERCKNISKSLTGRSLSVEHREKLSEVKTGEKRSIEFSKKMKEINTGRIFTEEHCENISKSLTGRTLSKEHREKLSKIIHDRPEEIKEKFTYSWLGKHHSIETIRIKTLNLDKIKKRYPFILDIEEMKEDLETKEIYGHCKNSLCENSIENDGWFKLTSYQIQFRIYSVLKNDGGYFFCSDKCKTNCDSYNMHGDPYDIQNELWWTYNELLIWKQAVLQNQFIKLGYNICQHEDCQRTDELKVHHIIPKKIIPEWSLDPCNGIILCQPHHDERHASGVYSYGNLAKIKRC